MKPSPSELKAAAIDLLPLPAFVVHSDGRILLRNAAAGRLLPPGERGEDIFQPAAPETPHWSELVAGLDGSEASTRRGVALEGSGRRRLLADVFARRLDESGAVLVVLVDVSAHLASQRRQATDGRLAGLAGAAAKIAHELNNPLDGVMRFVGLAERSEGAASRQYLVKARRGLERMAEIIRDLQGAAGRSTAATTLDRAVEEAVSVMQPRAEALGVAVVCELASDAAVPVEPAIFQVFCNVIKNALDAMADGGLLTVRVRRREGRAVVEFADTGPGLPEGAGEEIFRPFFTTKPAGEALGLGLAICREIVTRCGGTIAAATRAEGGACVAIELPVRGKEARDE